MSKATGSRHVQTLCRVFRVLSDETRVKLLVNLRGGEQHVSRLCKKLRLPQPTVSHHLGLLRIHGLLRARRDGKQVFYSVNKGEYAKAMTAIKAVLG